MVETNKTFGLVPDDLVSHQSFIGWLDKQLPASNFHIIDTLVSPGTKRNLSWCYPQLVGLPTTIVVVNGRYPGPILCLTAAIHGDELNGVEIARQIMAGIDPETLHGVVIGVPVVNLEGYQSGKRIIGDCADLNRCFPGSSTGSYPNRVANAFFNDIIRHCDALVDLHTGSSLRENHPQLRADLSIAKVAALSTGFGDLSVLGSIAPSGSLRGAATLKGIPALAMEIGGSLNLELEKVKVGVRGLLDLLQGTGMTPKDGFLPGVQHVYHGRGWIRAEFGGILVNHVELGTFVKPGDILADIIDPLTSEVHKVIAQFQGTILGRAYNQHVNSGFNLFRVGIE